MIVGLALILMSFFLSTTVVVAGGKKSSFKRSRASEFKSNQEITGFGEFSFNDGVLQLIQKLKKMGVVSIELGGKEIINSNDDDIVGMIFHDANSKYKQTDLAVVNKSSIETTPEYLLNKQEYVFNGKYYYGYDGTMCSIVAKPILINMIPYYIRFEFTKSLGYPVLHFENAIKYNIAAEEFKGKNLISTHRIASITLFPVSHISEEDSKAILILYKSKYGELELGSGYYSDHNGTVVRMAGNGYIIYSDGSYEYKKEEAAYRKYRLERSK